MGHFACLTLLMVCISFANILAFLLADGAMTTNKDKTCAYFSIFCQFVCLYTLYFAISSFFARFLSCFYFFCFCSIRQACQGIAPRQHRISIPPRRKSVFVHTLQTQVPKRKRRQCISLQKNPSKYAQKSSLLLNIASRKLLLGIQRQGRVGSKQVERVRLLLYLHSFEYAFCKR